MRYYEGKETFNYNWDQVARAYWCRYPNPFSKHVLTEDVVSRHVDDKGRLTNKAPKWAEHFVHIRHVMIAEDSIVDPKNKTFVTHTRNFGSSQGYMTIEDKVTYTASPDNNGMTVSSRQAWISSNFGYGLSRAIQTFGAERFKSNCAKANKGYKYVLDAMFNPASSFDKEAMKSLNPLLTEKLKERAKTLSKELSDKAKQKAVPVVAAMTSEKQ